MNGIISHNVAMTQPQRKPAHRKDVPAGTVKPEDLTYGRMPPVSDVPAPEKMAEGTKLISDLIDEALKPKSAVLEAEDCFRPGMENLAEMIRPLPVHPFVLESGTAEKQTNLSILFGKSKVSAATLPEFNRKSGGYCENKDAVVLATDPDQRELSIFLVHSSGYDPEDAAASNAAAITAAYETLEHPAAGLTAVFGTVEKQVSSVLQDLGEREHPEMIAGRLSSNIPGIYELDLASTGNQFCFVFHEDTPDYEVFHGGKIEITDENMDAMAENIVAKFSFERLEKIIKNDEQDPVRQAQMLAKLKEHFENGPSPELMKTLAERLLRAPVTARFNVAPDDIVLFAPKELVDLHGGADNFVKIVRDLIKSGPYTVGQVVKILVEDVEKDQNDKKFPDMSVSVAAFRVPENLTK